MRWFWGLVIILIGILLLGTNLGFLNNADLENLSRFWPLILVLLGVSLIFRQVKLGWLFTLLIFVISLGLVFTYLGFKHQNNTTVSEQSDNNAANFSVDVPANTKNAQITVKNGASEINVSADSEKLYEGTVTGGQPDISTQTDNDKTTSTISIKNLSNFFEWRKNTLNLKLSKTIPIQFDLETGASKANLDLTDLILTGSTIKAGANSINLKVGPLVQNGAKIDLSAGASSIDILTPKEVGTKVTFETGFSGKNINHFTQLDNQVYQSENYDSSNKKIEILIKAGASSISLNTF